VADVFATASGDCTMKIWDARQQYSSATVAAHAFEVLSVDWNKYNDALVATASVDKTVRVWDLRNAAAPLLTLAGHGFAVRRVKWSPFAEHVLFSASYDMTVAMWNTGAAAGGAAAGGAGPAPPLMRRWEHHTEFAVGLDASSLVDGLVASAGWDEMVHIWHVSGDPRTGG